MKQITKTSLREIIDNFTKVIEERKTRGPKPAKAVIDFRNELETGIERDVYQVPTELLRYRKDNGRISSDVLHYEKNIAFLNEKSENCQKILREFLFQKDKEKTEELISTIQHVGQREAAIITCDGFLINGNRRKMVMDILSEKFPSEDKYRFMKVVILPGKKDEGGSPTLLEIEQIENRYQLQSDGKAEYYGFDRALSMRKKIEIGMSLDHQLRDDPVYAKLNEKKFKQAIKKFEKEYLKPLECVDRYLQLLNRERLYSTISTSIGDPEGRWQAFLDYSNVYENLANENWRIRNNVKEDEIGSIENVAFLIIRKRELTGLPKVHEIMRELSKWVSYEDSKKELFKLNDIQLTLSKEECFGKNGKEFDERQKDKIWGQKYQTDIIRQVKKAKEFHDHKLDRDTPISLLEQALKKLYHEEMDIQNARIEDFRKGIKLASDIQKRANEIEREFYHAIKEYKKLSKKNNK